MAGDAANDVQWFDWKELPALGFDHALIVEKAVNRLKIKVLWQPIGFELLDTRFTIPELHTLYETILDKTFERRNFYKRFMEFGLGSMVWYAGYRVVMRGVRERVSAILAMLVTTVAAMSVAAIATLIMREPFLPAVNDWRAWGVLVGLGVVVHSGGQGFIAYGLGKLPIALSTILLFVQPVSAAVFGWLLFDEPLGAAGLAGAAMILAGVFIVQRARAVSPPAEAA